MEIYLVTGYIKGGKYFERVIIFDNMKEHALTYRRPQKSVSKNIINEVRDGIVLGSFQMHILDKKDIPYARTEIKKALSHVLEQELKEAQAKLKEAEDNLLAYSSHRLEDDIEISSLS